MVMYTYIYTSVCITLVLHWLRYMHWLCRATDWPAYFTKVASFPSFSSLWQSPVSWSWSPASCASWSELRKGRCICAHRSSNTWRRHNKQKEKAWTRVRPSPVLATTSAPPWLVLLDWSIFLMAKSLLVLCWRLTWDRCKTAQAISWVGAIFSFVF